jgi:hypothetical protein
LSSQPINCDGWPMVMAFGDHLQKEGAAAEEMPLEGRRHVFFNYWGVNLLPQTNAQRQWGSLIPLKSTYRVFLETKKIPKVDKSPLKSHTTL